MHSPPTAPALIRSLALVIALIAALVMAATVRARPAEADSSVIRPCGSGYVCIYDNDRFGGDILTNWPASRTSTVDLPSSLRDRTTSWINRGSYNWCAYNQRTLQGDEFLFTVWAGQQNPNVGTADNDKADYFRRC